MEIAFIQFVTVFFIYTNLFVCKLGAINKNINKKALAPLDTVQCTMVRKGEINYRVDLELMGFS